MSTPGNAALARWASTASPKLAVTTRSSPNVSPAQRRISWGVELSCTYPIQSNVDHTDQVCREFLGMTGQSLVYMGFCFRSSRPHAILVRCRSPVTFGYPVVLDLHGVPVLVVGAGPVAVRKVAGLVAAGADVRVVAPEIDERLGRPRTSRRGPRARLRRSATSTVCASSSPPPGSRRSTPPSPPTPAPGASGSTPPISPSTATSSCRRSPAGPGQRGRQHRRRQPGARGPACATGSRRC